MKYCPECGAPLTEKELSGEGLIPYCSVCGEFRFPVFSTAVSMIIRDPSEERILLIKQYGRPHNILVAGYVNKGENAEAAVFRETKEETGLELAGVCFNRSSYFHPSNTLMLNFYCTAASDSLDKINHSEVDDAGWYSLTEAKKNIKPGSLAESFLLSFIDLPEKKHFSLQC